MIARKGIDIAFELLRRLREPRARLIISHQAGDEGMAYYRQLLDRAEAMNVEVHYLAGFIEEQRAVRDGRKVLHAVGCLPPRRFRHLPHPLRGLWQRAAGGDLLPQAGAGQPLQRLRGRHRPLGFDFVEVDGWITDEAVSEVRRLLDDPDRRQAMADKNYELARQHFSYEVLAAHWSNCSTLGRLCPPACWARVRETS